MDDYDQLMEDNPAYNHSLLINFRASAVVFTKQKTTCSGVGLEQKISDIDERNMS